MPRKIVTLPSGVRAVAHAVKCYRTGCRRYKLGYLGVARTPGGQFYDANGRLMADLRDQEYACDEHGVADGSAPFLYPDPPKSKKARVTR